MGEMEGLQRQGSREAYNVFARPDVEFHSLVADACENRFLRDAIKSWSLQFHLFRRGYNPAWLQAVVDEHAHILQCVRDRDAEGAAAAMLRHVDNSYGRFRAITAVATAPTL